MPSPTQILAGLTAIANEAIPLALAWHVVLATVLAGLAVGWRPSRPLARALIALPLASVAALALAYGNPFNAAMFAAGAFALVALGLRGAGRPVSRGAPWAFAIGIAMIAFGWIYPHFLAGSTVAYLYAAPVGLVPCPTLSVVIGLALLGGGLGSRAFGVTLAGLGLFYGVFGVLRLGVVLDLGLVVGAVALGVTSLATAATIPAGVASAHGG